MLEARKETDTSQSHLTIRDVRTLFDGLSRETVAIATWYARLAQSVLDVRPGEEAGEP